MLKVTTWNVNSIKSRIGHLLDILRSENAPDIMLLQELKCEEDKFPYMEIEDYGYNIAINGQKTYNGVAILSKHPIDDVTMILPDGNGDSHARYIEGLVSLDGEAIRVASVYVPNGQSPDSDKFAYKLDFMDRLYNHTKNLLEFDEKLVIGGDYNIAPEDIDVYDPKGLDGTVCYHPLERQKLRTFLSLGMVDAVRSMHPEGHKFTWWDYRGGGWQYNKGMRIDHLMLSPEAADCLVEADIDLKTRELDKPSDHAPVYCVLG